ncbi:MAG: D-aminoacyl-tRNA deacylase [Gammaproteobacteria bacterium]
MIGLLQRVEGASVSISNKKVAEIDAGLLVLVGVEQQDSQQQAQRLFEKLIRYRVFPDSSGKMNLSLTDIAGGLLLVPQFTLVADTRKGLRPGFSNGASPDQGKQLFEYLVDHARQNYNNTESGVFGADMQISLVNDGPVTFWLQV